jgi:hypothetical protein
VAVEQHDPERCGTDTVAGVEAVVQVASTAEVERMVEDERKQGFGRPRKGGQVRTELLVEWAGLDGGEPGLREVLLDCEVDC